MRNLSSRTISLYSAMLGAPATLQYIDSEWVLTSDGALADGLSTFTQCNPPGKVPSLGGFAAMGAHPRRSLVRQVVGRRRACLQKPLPSQQEEDACVVQLRGSEAITKARVDHCNTQCARRLGEARRKSS